MRKVIAVILVLTFALSMPSAAGAEDSISSGIGEWFFRSLGYAEKYTDITKRGEIAGILADIMGYKYAGGTQYYYDIPENSRYYGAVGSLTELGIISGRSAGYFSPDDTLTSDELIKMAVCILGYEQQAAAKGGYPGGYAAIAAENGLLRGVNISGALTETDVYMLLYNMITVPWPKLVSAGQVFNYITDKDRTIMSECLKLRSAKGIVESNAHTALSPLKSPSAKGYVRIDGTDLLDACGAGEMIGRYIDYWYYSDDTDTSPEIRLFRDNRTMERLKIDIDDIERVDLTTVTYFKDGRTNDAKIDFNANYIYNGKSVMDYSTSLISEMTNGTVTFIDAENDGEYETVLIDTISSYMAVRSVYHDEGMISDYFGRGICYFDNEFKQTAVSRDGKTAAFPEINPDDVVVLYTALDGTVTKACISRDMINGSVDETKIGETKEYRINGKYYKTSADYDKYSGMPITLGINDTFIVYENIIVAAKGMGDYMQYAWLIDIAENGGVDDTVNLKVLSQLGGVTVVSAGSKVTVNGESQPGSELLNRLTNDGKVNPQLIKIKLNQNGVLKEVVTADILPDFKHDVKNATINYRTGSKGFEGTTAITSGTVLFSVPLNESDLSDDSLYRVINVSALVTDTPYIIDAYDLNEIKSAGAIVIHNDNSAVGIPIGARICVVDKITSVINSDGAETKKISYIQEGVRRSAVFKDLATFNGVIFEGDNAEKPIYPAGITQGSVIKFVTNSKNEIDYCRKLLDLNASPLVGPRPNPTADAYYNGNRTFLGTIVESRDGFLVLKLMNGDRNEVFYVGGSAKITVYNIKNGEARTGNTKFLDYMQSKPDAPVLLHSRYASVYDVVVYE